MILFDLASMEAQIKKFQEQTMEERFWENTEEANKVVAQMRRLEKRLGHYKKLDEELKNMLELNDMLLDEKDEELEVEVAKATKKLQKDIEKLEIDLLFRGKFDKNNAIISFHPGAGGTESQDWAEMLYRMYTKWANANDFEIKELDYLEGDEAGIKSVTVLISGENAYGYLKGEMGVHRLVRISPFDAGARRHTSFASVEVLPEITEEIEININPDDLRVDTYRASGAGGQHINKTDSAIRITHIPTGIVVSCQSERSQIQNRETAMKMLKSKLLDLKEKEHKEKIEDLKGVQREIAWGSQIRSYVFHPYQLVKDHRTGYETGNIDSVMNGDLNEFMVTFLQKNH